MRVLGISGSLRRDSWNAAVLRAAGDLLPADAELVVYDGLKQIPPYDADAILFATPEYNSSIPGVLKNAIDWASRPLATNPLRNTPVAVVGASTGAFGAVWAQAELRKVLAACGARVVDGEVAFGHVPTRFDEDGGLADDGLREQLAEVVEALADTARTRLARAA